MRHAKLATVLLLALVMAGCGAHRVTPVDPLVTGDLKPSIEDTDGGLVGIARGFSPKAYSVIIVEPFKVREAEIKDDEDRRLAKDMATHLQTQIAQRLRTAGVFARVMDAPGGGGGDGRALRLEGDITRLTEGSQALRYFVGFGAGAAKAQMETRLVDVQSRQVLLVTADRRAAAMGVFGGDGRQFVAESMDQMADGLVKLLKHLAAGGQPGAR